VIDFHCHLDLYPDPEAVIAQAEAKGVYLLAITTTPLAWEGMKRLVRHRKRCRAAAGLHPQLIAERYAEVDLLEHLLSETPYVGEVGLDGGPDCRGSFAQQDEVFRRVLHRCVTLGGRILSIHSRASAAGVLDALSAHPHAGLPVLHWFSGSRRELDRADGLGCWFSVGPPMLRSKKGRRLVEAMPRDRILTETDAPFTRRGTEPLMPWHVAEAEKLLSEIWQLPAQEVSEVLLENLRRLGGYAKTLTLSQVTDAD
jgi:TatD DNase family protein